MNSDTFPGYTYSSNLLKQKDQFMFDLSLHEGKWVIKSTANLAKIIIINEDNIKLQTHEHTKISKNTD